MRSSGLGVWIHLSVDYVHEVPRLRQEIAHLRSALGHHDHDQFPAGRPGAGLTSHEKVSITHASAPETAPPRAVPSPNTAV